MSIIRRRQVYSMFSIKWEEQKQLSTTLFSLLSYMIDMFVIRSPFKTLHRENNIKYWYTKKLIWINRNVNPLLFPLGYTISINIMQLYIVCETMPRLNVFLNTDRGFGNVGRSCSTRCNCCVTVVKDLMISYTNNEIARALYSYVLGVLSMVLVQ
jgi:hypothetical protein